MARFSIKHPRHQHDKFYGVVDTHQDPPTRLYKREHLIELRDLLNREFPDEEGAVECSAEFLSADGREWGCELRPGHDGLHAAPGVGEVEYRPQAPVDRRERIVTAVLAGLYASGKYFTADPKLCAKIAIEAADALIAVLDEGS